VWIQKGEIMTHPEQQYLDLLQKVLDKGELVQNRTGVPTYRLRAATMNFNLKEYFPLLTTKKVWLKGIVGELIWMLKGDTNIKFLVENKINIWNDDAYRFYCKNYNEVAKGEPLSSTKCGTKEGFLKLVKETDGIFGDLGPVYGYQWRKWSRPLIQKCGEEYKSPGMIVCDQIEMLIESLKNNPNSRRHILSAWNVADLDIMGLPPCHYSSIFSVSEGKYLNCGVTIRSNDGFLGSPFNIAQYALLTHIMAHWTGYEPGELDYWAYDFHIYENHIDAVKEQLKRTPKDFPKFSFKKDFILEDVEKVTDVNKFMDEYIDLSGYNPHPSIKAGLVT